MMRKNAFRAVGALLLAVSVLAFAGQRFVSADVDAPEPGMPAGSADSDTVSFGNECSGCGGSNLVTVDPPYKEESVEVAHSQGENGLINIQGSPHCTPLGGTPEEQAAAGAGGLMGNECSWVCGEERINFSYDNIEEEWGVGFSLSSGGDNGFDYSNANITNPLAWSFQVAVDGGFQNAGLPTCGEWTDGGGNRQTVEQICWKELLINGGTSLTSGSTGGTGSFVCAGDYDVKASASIPCPAVQRWPYPRGIVNAPVEFIISANGTAASDESREWCEPHIRNYTITVGWEQLPIPPLWHWDERPWSTQPLSTMGYHVFHTYDTASFGKPQNGPDTRGEMDHPAYQVKVETYWVPWVAESWDEWVYEDWDCDQVVVGERYNDDTGELEKVREWQGSECSQRQQCLNRGIEPYPTRSECGEWRERGSGRITVNLLEFGFGAPYVMFSDAQDITQPPPGLPDPQPRQCNIPVPVIESQGLLTAPNTP